MRFFFGYLWRLIRDFNEIGRPKQAFNANLFRAPKRPFNIAHIVFPAGFSRAGKFGAPGEKWNVIRCVLCYLYRSRKKNVAE